jgi:hypothetical protein
MSLGIDESRVRHMGSGKTGRGLDPYIAFRANATFVVVLALIVLFWLPMALVLALQGLGVSDAVAGRLFLALVLVEIVALVAWQTWRSVLFGHLRSVHDLRSSDERIPFPMSDRPKFRELRAAHKVLHAPAESPAIEP